VSVLLRRQAFRLAYLALRVWWFVGRPTVRGVQCILMDGDRVLLVRHTYGPGTWDLPGGTMKRGEKPRETAEREMAEELGLRLDGWRDLGLISGRLGHKRDRLYCFIVEVSDPALTVDEGELAEVRWFRRDELPPDLGRYVPRILAIALEGGR